MHLFELCLFKVHAGGGKFMKNVTTSYEQKLNV